MPLWVRAPDHLGDGVMALPAVASLARLARSQSDVMTVAGPGWAGALYGHLGVTIVGRQARPGREDAAVLFKPSFSAAWAARRARTRIGLDSDHRRLLLSVAVPAGTGHRHEEYGAVAAAAGAGLCGLPSLPVQAEVEATLPEGAVLLLPCSPSGAPVRWSGFRELADGLGGRAIFAAGPGEDEALARVAGPHPRLPALSVLHFATVTTRVAAVVGNDSGLAHLAAAARRGAGLDVGDVHVVYGSTDPARTGPPGSRAWSGTRPPCWPCYAKTCPIGVPCLDTRPADLLAALAAAGLS